MAVADGPPLGKARLWTKDVLFVYRHSKMAGAGTTMGAKRADHSLQP
jgi:hypothetical protein